MARATVKTDRYLAQVKSIALAALAGHGVAVYLFGSWARGEARRSSDIDIAVDAPRPLPLGVMARLREALEESTVPYQVDTVELAETSPEFRERVRREGVRWTVSRNG